MDTDLITQAFEVLSTFKSAGLLAGLVLLVNLLVNITKLPFVKDWVDKVKWVRAPLALALGGAAGLVAALVAGKSFGEILMMAFTGLVVGLGSVGLHEVAQSVKTARAA